MSTLSSLNETNEYLNIYTICLDSIKNLFLDSNFFKNNRKKNGFLNVYTKFISSNDKNLLNANYKVILSYIEDKKAINDIELVFDIDTFSNNLNSLDYKFISKKEINSIIDEFSKCNDFVRLFKRYSKFYIKFFTKLEKEKKNFKVNEDNQLVNEIVEENKVIEETISETTVVDDFDKLFDTDSLIKEFNDITNIKDSFEEIDDISEVDDVLITPSNEDNADNQDVLDVISVPSSDNIIRTNDNVNVKENEINHIRHRLYNFDDNSPLTSKEKIRIVDNFSLYDDNNYFSRDTVERSFNINLYIRNIQNNNDILSSMCSTAINCLYIRLNYLKETKIAYRDLETNRLFNLLGANNSNKLYRVAYDMFIKNLNKLDVDQQVVIREEFKDKAFDLYRKIFNINYFKIITPDELNSLINIKISEYIIANYSIYTDISNNNMYLNLYHVTNDMNINELLSTYMGLKNKLNKEFYNNVNEYNKRLVVLQEDFSLIIDNLLNKDNLEENNIDKKKRLSSICEKYLKDVPKFVYNNDINDNKVIYGKNKMESILEKMNNKNKE